MMIKLIHLFSRSLFCRQYTFYMHKLDILHNDDGEHKRDTCTDTCVGIRLRILLFTLFHFDCFPFPSLHRARSFHFPCRF